MFSNPATRWRLLFTLLTECYERRSVITMSNLFFSQWEQIFKDPLTTASDIDRVVQHSIIVKFEKEIPSHRAKQAAQRIQQEPPD
jgi:DNA replication protein DnaC